MDPHKISISTKTILNWQIWFVEAPIWWETQCRWKIYQVSLSRLNIYTKIEMTQTQRGQQQQKLCKKIGLSVWSAEGERAIYVAVVAQESCGRRLDEEINSWSTFREGEKSHVEHDEISAYASPMALSTHFFSTHKLWEFGLLRTFTDKPTMYPC